MKKPRQPGQQRATQRGLRRFIRSRRRLARGQSYRAKAFLPQDTTLNHLVGSLKKLTNSKAFRRDPPIRPTKVTLQDGDDLTGTRRSRTVQGTKVTLYVPALLSLSRNPAGSFGFLSDLIQALHKVRAPLLVLDYAICTEVDLDASVCMDAIMRRFISRHHLLRHHYRERAITCAIRAINLTHPTVRRFFWSTGAGQSIMQRDLKFPNILRMPLQTGRQDPTRLGRNEKTITDLFEHLEKCLARFGKQLTSKDAERFGDIIGEVLDNAEQHSSLPFNFACAHFEEHHSPPDDPEAAADETLSKGEHYGRFQIVICNFGQTIYERLKDPVACLTRATILPQMRDLSAHYNKKGWFGFGERPFQEETLWTLYALQDGVSSLRKDRGRGTIRFITDFLALRSKSENKKSQLTLMSGNTRIHLDGTYGVVEQENSLGEVQRRITFNDAEDLYQKPDPRVVTFVPQYLPGTLLYADIYLTDEHLQPV